MHNSSVNCFCEGVCSGPIRVGDGNNKAVIWNANGSIQDLGAGDHTEAHGYRNGIVTAPAAPQSGQNTTGMK